MPWTKKKNSKGEVCVFKEGTDGKPVGESLGCHPDEKAANKQLAALYVSEGKSVPEIDDIIKSMKCYDGEMAEPKFYVPWGVLSLADAFASKDAQHQAHEITEVVKIFADVAYNISASPDVKDKKAALAALGNELAALLDDGKINKDEMKSLKAADMMTGMAKDHKHKVMGDMTSESFGHKHKVKDGKIQTAEGHSHSMPEPKAVDFMAIKSLGNDRVGGYAVLWGSDTKKDLTGEWFTPKTAELTAIYDTVGRLPFLYHHGLDSTLKTAVIGVVDLLKADSIGLWYEAQLKLADEYGEYVKKLLADGKLKTSSQTFAVARQVNKSGEIERWPIVEITATPAPAEYRMQPIELLKSAYQEIGCTDFSCVLKKFGVESEGDNQGVVKTRLLAELENLRIEADLL